MVSQEQLKNLYPGREFYRMDTSTRGKNFGTIYSRANYKNLIEQSKETGIKSFYSDGINYEPISIEDLDYYGINIEDKYIFPSRITSLEEANLIALYKEQGSAVDFIDGIFEPNHTPPGYINFTNVMTLEEYLNIND